MIMIRLIESDVVLGVDNEIASIYIVPFHHHVKHFGVVDSSLFHEIDSFILNHDSMVNVVIELDLEFVLELTLLGEEVFFFNWVSEVLVVFGQEVELADVGPGVESIPKRVLSPDPNILATPEEEELMDLLFKVLPV